MTFSFEFNKFYTNKYFYDFLVVFLSKKTFCTVGSCLSYGHSCWGAHGKKRSDRIETDDSQYLDDRWALFRVVQNEVFNTNCVHFHIIFLVLIVFFFFCY